MAISSQQSRTHRIGIYYYILRFLDLLKWRSDCISKWHFTCRKKKKKEEEEEEEEKERLRQEEIKRAREFEESGIFGAITQSVAACVEPEQETTTESSTDD